MKRLEGKIDKGNFWNSGGGGEGELFNTIFMKTQVVKFFLQFSCVSASFLS